MVIERRWFYIDLKRTYHWINSQKLVPKPLYLRPWINGHTWVVHVYIFQSPTSPFISGASGGPHNVMIYTDSEVVPHLSYMQQPYGAHCRPFIAYPRS